MINLTNNQIVLKKAEQNVIVPTENYHFKLYAPIPVNKDPS